ncbi:FAD-binding oxidoreductase [Tomitella gaofuii]|uniref:FAD-binding oxidoreductase n=1 Tax=Tomitella gaofuii TaxID=2760083 RepID=UPI0015FCC9B6|nr:FAD-binding oxidoreductase [Tomitella gaofuii]
MSNETELVQELGAALSANAILTDSDVVESYRRDWSMDPDAGRPLAVVRARTEDDVRAVMRFASAHRIPVVPRGAGSSVIGGSTAVDGAITLSVEHLDDLVIDPETMTAVVGPGVINAELSTAAAERGMFYPPNPTSSDFCSIGGNVATDSGGPNGCKYGSTADYVVNLRVVLADGSVAEFGGPMPKATTGLPLMKLFIGAEGTLGVITRITLRLLPQPAEHRTVAAFFATREAAFDACADIAKAMRPSEIAVMDRPALDVAEQHLHMGLDDDTAAVLFGYSDADTGAAGEAALMEKICRRHGADDVFVTDDPSEGAMISRPREGVFDALEGRRALIVEDFAVPPGQISDLITAAYRIGDEMGQQILTYAYPVDGVVHPIILFDPADGESAGRAFGTRSRLLAAVEEMGGGLAAEYGIGADKRAAVEKTLDDAAKTLQRRTKAVFDPLGILNPRALVTTASHD